MAQAEFRGVINGINPDEFDAGADAEFLYQAMRGLGTNDRQLRTLITDRTNAQRQEIAAAYAEQQDGNLLVDRIMSETSGKYERTLVALMIPPAQYDAYYLRKAMDGVGTTESLLNEILCTRNGEELAAIRESFEEQTGESLISRVSGETGGMFAKHYKNLLVKCLENGRPDGDDMDEDAATEDAETLHTASAGWGTTESDFVDIFATRSFSQLKLICQKYEQEHDRTLRSICEHELSGHFEDAVLTILDQAVNPVKLWGEKIRDTMKGLGTDEESLIRLIVTRSERDLASIRDVFGEEFGDGVSIQSWVESDTSGSFEKILVSILTADLRDPIRTAGDEAEAPEEYEDPPADEVMEEVVENPIPEQFRLILMEGDMVDESMNGAAITAWGNEESDVRNDSSVYLSVCTAAQFGGVFTMTDEGDGTGFLALVLNEGHDAQYFADETFILCGRFEERDSREEDGALYAMAQSGGMFKSAFYRPTFDENMCGELRIATEDYGAQGYALTAQLVSERDQRSGDSAYVTAQEGPGAMFQFAAV